MDHAKIFAASPAASNEVVAFLGNTRQSSSHQDLFHLHELAAENERNLSEWEQVLERQEEEEFQKALTTSREELGFSASASTSGMAISHIPGVNHISASTSSQPGPAFLQPTPSSSLLVVGRPVTRVLAANQPTITNHLSPEWMRPYEDRTQQPQAITGRGQLDIEMVWRFRVEIKIPSTFIVHVCPQWPKWRITDCPTTLKCVGEDDLEFYDIKHHLWLECPVSCPHLVKTDDYFFLWRAGIECRDFEARLELATWPLSTSRVYMTTAHKSLQTKALKQKERAKVVEDDDDSEVEVLGSPVPIPKRRKIKQEQLLSPPSFHSPSALSSSAVSSHLITPLRAIPTSPTLTATSGPTVAPEIFVSSPLTGPPPLPPGSKLVWPSNMYVVDMAYGFCKMDQLLKAKEGNYESQFYQVFKQPPAAESTYYDQVQQWEIGSPALCEVALAAGQTSAGHWSTYAKRVPLKK
ncbi:hypothetical protein BYT27DRAFT_7257779 [Phlegmacium glaucopus]|nr:hypothetical protein BYT27DRAFT_7257779 [Phlegmacium glaucopus]